MDHAERLAVYEAQTSNTRTLLKAKTQLRRSINLAYRKNDLSSIEVHTKLLALLFCAWAEANFQKTIHTPHGFSLNDIAQIKSVVSSKSLTEGWKETLKLGLVKVSHQTDPDFIHKARQDLLLAIKDYVEDPSLIRNKIAHGQWSIALNRGNTARNHQLTQNIQSLNIVIIDSWFECHAHLAHMVESLIESPNKAFTRDYNKVLSDFEKSVQALHTKDINHHIAILKKRPIRAEKA